AIEAVVALVVDDVIRSGWTRIPVLVKPGVVAVVVVTHRSDPPKVERRRAHHLVDRWSFRFIPEGGRREAGGGSEKKSVPLRPGTALDVEERAATTLAADRRVTRT